MVESNTTPVTGSAPHQTTPKKVRRLWEKVAACVGRSEAWWIHGDSGSRSPVGKQGGVVTEGETRAEHGGSIAPSPQRAPEPEVQSFIRQFEERYPGRKYQSGHNRKTSDGREIEIDFETDNSIIESRRVEAKGLTRQIGDRMDPAVTPRAKSV